MNISETKSRIISEKFSWNGVAPAPFGTIANISFHVDNKFTRPVNVEVLISTAHLISRFIGTFNAVSRCMDMSHYQTEMSEVLERAGFSNSALLPLISWPIMQDGLTRYAISLNELLLLSNPDSEYIKIPISAMHLWALGETARAFLDYSKRKDLNEWGDEASKEFTETCIADAKLILHLTEMENIDVNKSALPYVNFK